MTILKEFRILQNVEVTAKQMTTLSPRKFSGFLRIILSFSKYLSKVLTTYIKTQFGDVSKFLKTLFRNYKQKSISIKNFLKYLIIVTVFFLNLVVKNSQLFGILNIKNYMLQEGTDSTQTYSNYYIAFFMLFSMSLL